MLRRVSESIGKAVDRIVISCREEQLEEFEKELDGLETDLSFVVDHVEAGPAAGLDVSVEAVDQELVAVSPCDLPFLTEDVYAALEDKLSSADREVESTVISLDGKPQPLVGVYRVDSVRRSLPLKAGSAAFALLDEISFVAVPADEVTDRRDVFLNVNTVKDIEKAREVAKER